MSNSFDIGTSVQSARAREIFQTVVKSRKSWKTSRDNGEAVWPPELEAALLEGLEHYQPGESRETKLLGRFPMRNKFVSEHIFRVTGKRRTAKQVGSRLQQLRDNCGGERLLKLLAHRDRDIPSEASWSDNDGRSYEDTYREPSSPGSSSRSSSSCPATPVDEVFPSLEASHNDAGSQKQASSSYTTVNIDILPKGCSWSPESFTNSSSGSSDEENASFRATSHSRPLHLINPTVTFLSPSHIVASSFFSVIIDNRIVHTEIVPLVETSPPPNGKQEGSLFSAALVPEYWERLCSSQDPTRYSIVQEVIPTAELLGSTNPDTSGTLSILFSAVYVFRYPPELSGPPPSPPGLTNFAEISLVQSIPDSTIRDCILSLDREEFLFTVGSEDGSDLFTDSDQSPKSMYSSLSNI